MNYSYFRSERCNFMSQYPTPIQHLSNTYPTPIQHLSDTYPTPIRHLSNLYPTRSGCVKITHGRRDMSGARADPGVGTNPESLFGKCSSRREEALINWRMAGSRRDLSLLTSAATRHSIFRTRFEANGTRGGFGLDCGIMGKTEHQECGSRWLWRWLLSTNDELDSTTCRRVRAGVLGRGARAACFLVVAGGLGAWAGEVRVTDFGAQPDSRRNAVVAVQRALEACRKVDHPVLVFPAGRYDFWPQGCVERDYFESNTTANNPKRLGIFIENLSGVTIDGGGSTFVFHDRMQPFTVDHCSGIDVAELQH